MVLARRGGDFDPRSFGGILDNNSRSCWPILIGSRLGPPSGSVAGIAEHHLLWQRIVLLTSTLL